MTKHFFQIHSNITFIIALQYIKDKSININNCVFILCRSFVIPQDKVSECKNVINYPKDVFGGHSDRVFMNYNLIKARKNTRILEGVIKKYAGELPFIMYYCNTISKKYDFVSVCVTMKNCVGYYLLEEGTGAYYEQMKVPHKMSGLRKIIYKCFLQTFLRRYELLRDNMYSTNSKKFKGTIAVSKKAFPGYRNNFIINNPYKFVDLGFKPDAILSVDPLFHFFEINDVEAMFRKLYQTMKGMNIKTLACKYHPDFFKYDREYDRYKAILQDIFGEDIYELPRTTIIENILISCKSVFFSDMSSAGIYASNYGIKCYSYAKYLFDINPAYNNKINGTPQIIKTSYIFLEK